MILTNLKTRRLLPREQYCTIIRTMDLKKFKECVESCYQSLLGQIFEVKCKQKGSSAVTTGGPRDVLVIDDQTTAIIRRIKI